MGDACVEQGSLALASLTLSLGDVSRVFWHLSADHWVPRAPSQVNKKSVSVLPSASWGQSSAGQKAASGSLWEVQHSHVPDTWGWPRETLRGCGAQGPPPPPRATPPPHFLSSLPRTLNSWQKCHSTSSVERCHPCNKPLEVTADSADQVIEHTPAS